jgi:hypothetical protein
MNIQLDDLTRFFVDQVNNEPVEVCLTYQSSKGNPRLYTFIKDTTPEGALDQIKATHDRYINGMKETAERWDNMYGANWKEWYNSRITEDYDQAYNRVWGVLSWEEWEIAERAFHIQEGKLAAITHEEWWDYFEVLPPLRYERDDIGMMESFLMSEYYTATFTSQYVSCKAPELLSQLGLPMGTHICVSRLVDAVDKKTWITYSEVCEWVLANKELVIEKCQHEITNNQEETTSETSQ